jgi:7-keto-8-aminopelargonate synthetase-like enzyme
MQRNKTRGLIRPESVFSENGFSCPLECVAKCKKKTADKKTPLPE